MYCVNNRQTAFYCYLQLGHVGECKSRKRHNLNSVVVKEAVNHPAHYGGADAPHEVIKCLRAWGLESDALLWNTVKYIARAGRKDVKTLLEDLRKAQWFLGKRIDDLEEKGK